MDDNIRYLKDVEKWLNFPIHILKNKRYDTHWEVIEDTGYLVSEYGARCTLELKKKVRQDYQRFDDVNIIGYTLEEKHRADRIEKSDPFNMFRFPLIEENISKEDCLGMIWKSGLKLPVMYDMGYNHNNCVGCVKGGKGYWNKIRIDFPNEFKRMAKIERKLGITIIRELDKEKSTEQKKIYKSIYLDELNPNEGNYKEEKSIQCGIYCELAYKEFMGEADKLKVVASPISKKSAMQGV